ncbi:organic cation transporter protein-like [Watersipora subatra]|uniref:organic cation transporter protein-like n=1 Tax=Watersipora subatra TaxID=2589382 RepID=UPI00355C0C31
MSASEDGEGNINDILREIGVPGRYQLYVFFWTFVTGVVSAWQTVAIPFTQADMPFRCKEGNISETLFESEFNNTCFYSNLSLECQQFEYDTSIFSKTVVSQFDLVCSRVSYTTISNIAYMVVAIPFGVVSGWLSDRFGRRSLSAGSMVSIGLIGLVMAFSVNIEMYIALRCLMSIPTIAVYDSTNSFLSEITSPVKRPHLLIGSVISWSVSICLASPLAYWLTNWFHLQIAISLPSVVIGVILWWAYDESPHWLFGKKRYKEAQLVLDKIARWNKLTDVNITLSIDNSSITDQKAKQSGEKSLETKEGKKEKTNACVTICRHPKFIVIFLICSFGWFACNLGYYGLLFGIGDLVGDIYVNNLVAGGVEFVSYTMCFLILRGGRKKVYVPLLLIGGSSLVSSAIAQLYAPGVVWLIVTLTMSGRLCISAAWQILYVWCLELFPTHYRLTMLQASLTFGHIGSAIGTLMADLSKLVMSSTIDIDIAVPIVYGSLMLIAGLAAIYAPETKNKPLPVTIEEAVRVLKRNPVVQAEPEVELTKL